MHDRPAQELVPLPTLAGPRTTLRPIVPADVAEMAAMITTPGAAEWWGPIGAPEELHGDILQDGAAWVIEVDGGAAGWLGVWEEPTPAYRHAGLDIMLAPAFHGRGLGPEALATAIRWLIDDRGHHRITIDPAADNLRAIHAYESIGFRPVGILRSYEQGSDGQLRDGLLMDLLAGELRPAP